MSLQQTDRYIKYPRGIIEVKVRSFIDPINLLY